MQGAGRFACEKRDGNHVFSTQSKIADPFLLDEIHAKGVHGFGPDAGKAHLGIWFPCFLQAFASCRLKYKPLSQPCSTARNTQMGIDSESDTAASIQIGPTTLGTVRIYLEGDGIDLPLDFEPEEAEEIAEELRAAAAAARKIAKKR